MSTTVTEAPSFPIGRDNLFDPAAELATFPEISPLRLPVGDDGWRDGWLVTSHALARSVLADPRFSAERYRAVLATRVQSNRFRQGGGLASAGMFISMDDPEHAKYRKMLTGQFTVKHMRALEPRIQQIVDAALDDVEAAGPGADLVELFALPVPSLVICELLGVDYDNRATFQDLTRRLLSLTITPEESRKAVADIRAFMGALVTDKRAHPDDAVISGLITSESGLTDEELIGISMLLLIAGHETTANMLGLGTFALLQHPDQLARLRAEPELMTDAVEELMRYLSIVGSTGLPRVALEDVSLGDADVKAGETVLISLPAVNRDPALGEHPEELDVTRGRTHHLAFGHGVHQCLGQQLARVEMRMGFRALLARFPSLRLAVPASEVPMRTDMTIYGVHALPVAW
jgi:cytochrome P450